MNSCTNCGPATVCTGTNAVYAQPYEGARAAWSRSGRTYGEGANGCWPPRPDRCFPYYCGPCGPAEQAMGNGNPCACPDGCHCLHHSCACQGPCICSQPCLCPEPPGPYPCGCLCREPVYGFFTQVGTIDVNAGGMIPFNGGSTVEGIWKDGGELTLDTAGVYMVTLSADIPEGVAVDTELDVRVNGVTSPGGRLILSTETTDPALMTNTQTVITVNEGAVLTVTSSEAIAFSTSSASQPIITLSVVKIS